MLRDKPALQEICRREWDPLWANTCPDPHIHWDVQRCNRKVVGPIHTVLNQGTSHECKTFTTEGAQFLVTKGVEQLYDVLLSTHVARDWGVRADPVSVCLNTTHT